MKEYVILHDGREIAGRRNPGKGGSITLSDAEAKHPLRLGHIALKAPEKPKGKK